MRFAPIACLFFITALLASCASFSPRLEAPAVNIVSLELLESQGLSQRFGIGLVVTNPNSVALPIQGMSYTLSLNGFDLINGASNQVPTLDAYSDTPVTIEATADMFAVLRLLNSLASARQDQLRYQFAAKLDPGGLRPVMNVKREGQIELSGYRAGRSD